MKYWQKGMIFGLIMGIIGDLFFLISDKLKLTTETFFGKIVHTIGYLFVIPFKVAVFIGFHFIFVFFGAILIWIAFGGILGYIYGKYMGWM